MESISTERIPASISTEQENRTKKESELSGKVPIVFRSPKRFPSPETVRKSCNDTTHSRTQVRQIVKVFQEKIHQNEVVQVEPTFSVKTKDTPIPAPRPRPRKALEKQNSSEGLGNSAPVVEANAISHTNFSSKFTNDSCNFSIKEEDNEYAEIIMKSEENESNHESKNSDQGEDKAFTKQNRFNVAKDLEKNFNNKEVALIKPPQLEPDVSLSSSNKSVGVLMENNLQFKQFPPELTFLARDLIDGEKVYISQLTAAIGISHELEKRGLSQLSRHKLFGYFSEIKSFHEKKFAKDLNKSEIPKQFALCFVKHFTEFNLYTQREWLIHTDLSEFEEFEIYLIKNLNLENYFNLTKQRVLTYAKSLQCFRSICDQSKDIDSRLATDEALKVITELDNQIQLVQKIKKLFGKASEKFKECGRILLNEKFKVSINGSTKKNFIVYLCENIIIFADFQRNDNYQYVDGILTSHAYCSVIKNKNKFEIGLKGCNSFILTAASQNVRDQWCKELRKLLKDEMFSEA